MTVAVDVAELHGKSRIVNGRGILTLIESRSPKGRLTRTSSDFVLFSKNEQGVDFLTHAGG
jgi:hypothetical protein